MTAALDVSGPINAHLRAAERKFDAAILELTPPDQRASLVARRTAPGMYAIGQMIEALNEAFRNAAAALTAGQRDYRNGIRP